MCCASIQRAGGRGQQLVAGEQMVAATVTDGDGAGNESTGEEEEEEGQPEGGTRKGLTSKGEKVIG